MNIIFTRLKSLLVFFSISVVATNVYSQSNCVPIDRPISQNVSIGCNSACTKLSLSVPHIKQISDYAVQSIPYNPRPFTSPTGIELTNLYSDDKYSPLQTIPFNFCFYDSSYNSLVVGSNGLITFDAANQATCNNAFALEIGEPIPRVQSVGPCGGIFTPYYPRASIMGAFFDIDPSVTTGHPGRKIEYRVDGLAPCRSVVVSFNDIAVFSCNADTATFQIILHEGTGIIEVFIKTKTICSAWNDGLGILGIQNWQGNKGVAAPGKNDTEWSAFNEGYRFLPIGGASRFVKSELLLNNAVIATADTSTVVTNELLIDFPNVCPSTATSQYVIRTEFTNCLDPLSPLIRLDTVNITKTADLTGTTASTQTVCAGTTGTLLVTANDGVAPYTFTITGPGGPYAPQVSATNTTTFTGLGVGNYSITIADNAGCSGIVTGSVANLPNLTSTFTKSGASCPGVNNGTIIITPDVGTAAGPYTFTANGPGGPYVLTNVASTASFLNLPGGTFSVIFTNAGGCSGSVNNIVITPGTAITSTSSTSSATCQGANNGSLTVTATSGTAPYSYSLDGGTSQPTGVFTGIAQGNYTVTITDVNGCTGTKSVTVSASGAGITSTVAVVKTTCPGINDGTITITPTSGTPPYTYSLNGGTFQSSNVFTGVAAATSHNVVIKDANGCTGNRTVGVQAGTGLTVTGSSTPTSCLGASDGTATAVPGTAGTYTYTLNPTGTVQANNPVFTGLAAGTYTITMAAASGCTGTTANIVVTAGTSLTGTATGTTTSCTGVADGTITVVPGTPGAYTYTLNPGAVSQSNPLFTGVAAGTYTVMMSAASGCSGTTANIVVAAGPALSGTGSTTPTSCAGVSDGSLTVVPGIAGTYTYTLNPGGPTQASPTFTGLPAGTYTVTMSATSGCSGTTGNLVIASGPALTGTGTSTATSCAGVNDGSVTAVPAMAGTYTYTLNPGGPTQASPTFTGLATGTYTVSMAAANGCSGTTTNIVVSAGAALTATASATPTSCSGVNDGSVTAVPGVPGTYSYTLNPGSITQSSPVFTGLAPGTYTVTITAPSGCIGTTGNAVVAAGSVLTGTATTTATSCPTVNDGTITITPGGTGPYSFTLNPGNKVQSSPIFTGLAPDTYTITFTTASGCNGTVAVNPVVGQGAYLTSTTTLVQPDCANINDGTITIVPGTEAVAPYTSFTLTGSGAPVTQVSPLFTNLAPGNYTYSFIDGNGCTGTGTAVLSTNPALATTVALTSPLCNGNNNGVIALVASGGVAPYEYALSPFATYQSSGTFNTLTSGTYTIRIRDSKGCTKDTTVTLTQPTALTAAAVNTSTAGCAGSDGIITVTGSGGTTPYQYSLDGTGFQSNNVITAPAVGPYTAVTVKDANGCTATASTTVGLVDDMFLTIGNDTTICQESSITFQPQTNPGTNIFEWRPLNTLVTLPATINDPRLKNAVATPTETATYILHATWGACSREDTILINVLRKPIPNAGLDTAICNETFAILRGSATNLSGTVNFTWSPSTTVDDDSSATTIATPGPGGTQQTYILTVTDNYGCNYSVKDSVVITIQPPVPAFAGNDTIAIKGVPHQLFGKGGVDYLWNPGFPLNFTTAQNPLATLNNDQQFILKVTDVAGCIGYDTVFVQVYEGPNYYVPNAFSPNGDGLNDIFRVIPVGIAKTDYLRVFNRYGQLVFETNQWLKGWDGRVGGKMQPIGAYVWMVKGVDKNGRIVEEKGTVLLVQ